MGPVPSPSARCAVATNRLTEAEQLVSMIKSNHKEEIKSTPAINAALSYVELSLAAPRGKEVSSCCAPGSCHLEEVG